MVAFDDDEDVADGVIEAVTDGVAVAVEVDGFDAGALEAADSGGAVGGAVVHDENFVHMVAEVVNDGADGGFLVVSGYDEADAFLLDVLGAEKIVGVVIFFYSVDVSIDAL